MTTGWHKIALKTFLLCVMICAGIFVSPAKLIAQVPNLTLQDDLDGLRITPLVSVYKSEEMQDPGRVWNDMIINPNIGELDFGFTDSFIWLGVTLQKNTSDPSTWLLEVENPHINHIYVYQRNAHSQEWEMIHNTGRRTPFATRQISHFNYIFPIQFQEGSSADLLLLLDKKKSSINYHIKTWKATTFNSAQQTDYILIGSYFGIFFLIITSCLIAFLFSFKRIYFWYLVYVVSVGLFISSDLGISHQYLWPERYFISSFARVLLACTQVLSFILFTAEYFNTKRNYPKINITFNVLIAVVAIVGLFYLSFTETFRENATLFLIILYTVILAAIALAIITSILFLKKQRNVALFFISAFSFIFIGSFITISSEFGIVTDNLFLFTPLQVSYLFEIIFLACGIGWRVKVLNEEQQSLQDRINRLQTEKLKAYIEGIEEERRRLAMDLHDAIGNRLNHLKRLMQNNNQSGDTLQEEVQLIIQDVRQLSHQLSPPSIGLTGLQHSIHHLIDEVNRESNIHYIFQSLDIPEKLPEDYSIQIYRIVQEAVQNIEKHSRATEAVIQFIGHTDQLILTIEDDGVGFEQEENRHSDGIGLGNIDKRVERLGGILEMTSQKQKGVQFLISIPLPEMGESDREKVEFDGVFNN